MIGIGKWEVSVNTLFVKGTGVAEIIDNAGEYEIKLHLPEKYKNIRVTYKSITEIPPNKLHGVAEISAFPGKEFEGEFTFTDSTCSGYVSIPMLGGKKFEFKNGRKIG